MHIEEAQSIHKDHLLNPLETPVTLCKGWHAAPTYIMAMTSTRYEGSNLAIQVAFHSRLRYPSFEMFGFRFPTSGFSIPGGDYRRPAGHVN